MPVLSNPSVVKRNLEGSRTHWQALARIVSGVVQTKATNEAAKAKDAFYQKALQDLTLFKSKTNAALLQVCSTQCLL